MRKPKFRANSLKFFGLWQHVLLLATLFCLRPFSLRADNLVIEQGDHVLNLYPYLEIAIGPDTEGADFVTAKQLNFLPLASSEISLEDQRFYTLRFRVRNEIPISGAQTSWVLKFPLVITEAEYQVYRQDEFGQSGRTGFFVPLDQRSFAPSAKGNYARFYLLPGELVTIYLRVRCDRYELPPDLRLELISTNTFFSEKNRETLFNGVFVGFVVLLLLYNLFLFFLAQDYAYVYYSVYLAALCLFTVYNTGDLWDWVLGWWSPEHPQYIAYFKLVTYGAVVAYLAFLRVFLDLDQLMPKWDRGLQWFGYIAIIALLLDGYLIHTSNYNYDVADIVTVSYFLVFLLLMLWFLWPLVKTNDSKRYFIIAGVLAMVAGILLTLLDRMRTVDFSTFWYKVGTIIEVVIFSLGLAYRQREAEQETQQAEFALERARLLQVQRQQEAEQLATLDAAKSRFYTHLTHELRTPLTVIKGLQDYLSRQLTGLGLPESIKVDWYNSLDLIGRNSNQLLVHINQLLELAKLQSGNRAVQYQYGDIISYLNYLAESFYSLAAEQEIRLLFYQECQQLEMDYDEHKLQQIIYNLLSNALQHTAAGGKVILHARLLQQTEQQDQLQIKVMDSGVGISPDELEHIFRLFYQSGTRPSGSGIGLTLTKELVELLEGQITVESELGKGSVFTILLPVRRRQSEHLAESPPSKPYAALTTASLSGSTGEMEDDLAEDDWPLLLLVEDNPDVMSFLKKILQKDYRLITAGDGEEGLLLAIKEVPDLIVSDVMMPKMDGFALCQKLKSDARTSHIPVVLLTAKASDADRIAGLRTGADAYLMKPFQAEELFLRLENLFRLRQKIQVYLTEQPANTSDSLPGVEEAPVAKESGFLQDLRQLIKANLDKNDLSTSFLAREMHLSESQLYRKLKALTNKSPSVFVRGERLKQAAVLLLLDPDQNIAEIAYDCGFNDPNYFSRAFHQKFGCSPTEYRSKMS